MKIAVDFDGTCVEHRFPEVGPDVEGAVPVLKMLVNRGHKIILFTMRSDREKAGGVKDDTIQDVTGAFLTDAVNWFKEWGIPLHGIQTDPQQASWTTSPKAYAEMYIDDAALGCPLIYPASQQRPYVDWWGVFKMLRERGEL